MNVYLCLCSHPIDDHEVGIGSEECLRVLHPACGCDEYRLDVRSPVRVETEGAA